MPLTLELPNEYGWVLLVAASTPFLQFFHMETVSSYRKKAGIKYPQFYATPEQAEKNPAAFTFNCAQRAHGNFLENQPSFIVGLLLAGLRWPVISAGFGAAWVASRVVYTLGYTRGGPSGRLIGSLLSGLASLCLGGMAAYTSWKLAMGE